MLPQWNVLRGMAVRPMRLNGLIYGQCAASGRSGCENSSQYSKKGQQQDEDHPNPSNDSVQGMPFINLIKYPHRSKGNLCQGWKSGYWHELASGKQLSLADHSARARLSRPVPAGTELHGLNILRRLSTKQYRICFAARNPVV